MLQQRFKRIYPDKEIEIISTAMSAINSYSLLDFTDEIIEIEPDLILIYAGHNEFVGIMGVGSALASQNSRSTTLMFLALKELKLFQLMQSVIAFFQNQEQSTDSNLLNTNNSVNKRTLMAQIAKEKNITLNSELYNQGVTQFSDNLDLILEKYNAKNIPVLISTLASNEKDQSPFASGEGETSANSHFENAQSLLQQKKYHKALQAFIQAKDKDQLRFRAPSQFNEIIKQKVDVQSNKKLLHLVDAETMIRKDSNNGIIGFQHMHEHLHPNARGYFLLAEAFVKKIVNENLISNSHQQYASQLAWKDIPLTEIDKISASFKIKTLVSDYPFRDIKQLVKFGEPTSFAEKMAKKKLSNANWLTLHQEMLKHYQETTSGDKLQNVQQAAKIAGLIFDAFPNQHKAAWVAAQLYFSINDTEIAEYYIHKATLLQIDNIKYLMNYAYVLYTNKKILKANSVLEQVLKLDPLHAQALQQKKRLSKELER